MYVYFLNIYIYINIYKFLNIPIMNYNTDIYPTD